MKMRMKMLVVVMYLTMMLVVESSIAEEMKLQHASDQTMNDPKEETSDDSWVGSARQKFSGGSEVGQGVKETAQDMMMNKAGNAASGETMNIAPSKKAWEVNGDKNSAKEAYDDAKQNVEENYNSAIGKMSEKARTNYEDAKEKASQATGDLGASIRAEL